MFISSWWDDRQRRNPGRRIHEKSHCTLFGLSRGNRLAFVQRGTRASVASITLSYFYTVFCSVMNLKILSCFRLLKILSLMQETLYYSISHRPSVDMIAHSKGVVVGRVIFSNKGEMIDCAKMRMGGKVIPPQH